MDSNLIWKSYLYLWIDAEKCPSFLIEVPVVASLYVRETNKFLTGKQNDNVDICASLPQDYQSQGKMLSLKSSQGTDRAFVMRQR